jgi:hypothetical protein
MRQFTIAVATVAFAGLILLAPASADYNGGGPRKQNGQCWQPSKGTEGFGYWHPCPQLASGRATRGRGAGQAGQSGQESGARPAGGSVPSSAN